MHSWKQNCSDAWLSLKLRWRRGWWRLMKPADVQSYYDTTTEKYLQTYGRCIQALRHSSDDDFIRYLSDSIGLGDGIKALDAGCGVCGPSIAFAKLHNLEIDALTISQVQVEEAERAVSEAGLEKRIRVKKGDFHHLAASFDENAYDRVFFLESLGYSHAPHRAVAEARRVLKPGGMLYVKDFFPVVPANASQRAKIRRHLSTVRDGYSYNTLDLEELIRALRRCGFLIDFIRRMTFAADHTKPSTYEKAQGLNTLEAGAQLGFEAFQWLEIRCAKPSTAQAQA